ncbi:MAG: VWA-like domain-containing protein [Saprospiraceae bacterium]
MPVARQITRASIALLLEQPFFGRLLGDIGKEADPARTASVCIRYEEPVFVISVNPDFWQRQVRSLEEQMGHLLHQLLHLSFGHLHRAADFPDPFLFDVAADLQANAHVPAAWHWPGAVRREDLAGFPIDDALSLFAIYEKLEMLSADAGRQFPAAFAQLMAWKEAAEALFEPHRQWRNGNRIGREMSRWSAYTLLQQAEREAPAGMQLFWKKEREEPQVQIHWRKLLRQFAQSSRSTFIKDTIHRPSKRYGVHPGVRVRRRQRLLVAVDTSGSLSRGEQAEFFSEIRFLSRTGAEVTILEFDAEVKRVYPYRGQRPEFLVGGGDTNFVPVLEYANAGDRWDGLIIFTDGFAPIPRIGIRPPVLWVVTAQGLSPATGMYQSLPGLKLKLRKIATLGV